MAYDRDNELELIVNTDGGSRGNPGVAGIGYVIRTPEQDRAWQEGLSEKALSYGGAYIGETTNNIAEYRALLWGLSNARALAARAVVVRADSELMIKQLKGEYKVKNEGLKPLYQEAMALLSGFGRVTLEHVYRASNKRADELANQGMDELATVGAYHVPPQGVDLFSLVDSADDASAHKRDAVCTDKPTAAPQATLQAIPEAAPREASDTTPSTREKRRGMFHLTVKSHFDAAHALVGYPGECRNLHGHTWDVECTIKGSQLDEVGILYDFKAIKRDLNSILDRFDHKYMNEVPPFDTLNSTAENLSEYIFGELEKMLPEHIELEEVVVWESPIAKTTYTRD